MTFELVGTVAVKDFYTKDGKTTHTVRIDYDGGTEQFRYESAAELAKFPDVGQPVKVRGKLSRNGDYYRFSADHVEQATALDRLLASGITLEQLQGELGKRKASAA